MLLKTRLGKRSPLGALLSSSCQETEEDGIPMATASALPQTINRVGGRPGLRVYFQGRPSGVVDQLDLLHSDTLSPPSSRSVSSCIDVPRSQRRPEDVDELMAAMVLSSLSCSPLLHSATALHSTAPLMDCGSGELSDGGSSGYWSVGNANGSPAPSPPIAEHSESVAVPPDEGLDVELDQVLFGEPAPRKRRNSVKAAYRCLWPGCGKMLTSVVGIKRHVRTTHLSRSGEHERCSRSEEDFYYTEINQWDQSSGLCGPSPSPPPNPPSSNSAALSCSAPSSSNSTWQVQSEHSYQAPPSSHVTAAAVLKPSCWSVMATPTSCVKEDLATRVRSSSVGEQWLQQHSTPCRRIRGEAKKCRKVYGIEHKEQWCTACRWKKACQRFLD
ncbi:uncharacterized protein V6R79_021492 [Siganus canaliculatus]